ncbi:hypothetical protein JNK13_07935 [bacterium]|nr:hypothetical protein [bacterium]
MPNSIFIAEPENLSLLNDEIKATLSPRKVEKISERALLVNHSSCKNQPLLAFAKQVLLEVDQFSAPSVSKAANFLFQLLLAREELKRPLYLHVFDLWRGVTRRSDLIRNELSELLKQKRRSIYKDLAGEPLRTEEFSVLQLALANNEAGYVSLQNFVQGQPLFDCVSKYPGGDLKLAIDKNPPSRAYLKLVEAQLRFGEALKTRDTVLDLGSSPGGWAYVALQAGANVIAVDRSELRSDLMRNPRLQFHAQDAFKFVPEAQVDWLICDLIAFPEKTLKLLELYLENKYCRKFIVTLKFRGNEDYQILSAAKKIVRKFTSRCYVGRMQSNKNEVTLCGECF